MTEPEIRTNEDTDKTRNADEQDGTIHVPNVPVPEHNPGGTYNPDTSTTSKG